MNKLEFEAEIADFCKCWLSDYIEDYHVGYNELVDGEIEACIDIEMTGNRRYAMTLRAHPDKEMGICIQTYDDNYLDADGAGLYLWLWITALHQENEMMRKAGLQRMGDGDVTAKYYVEDGRHVWLSLDEWHEKRKKAAFA